MSSERCPNAMHHPALALAAKDRATSRRSARYPFCHRDHLKSGMRILTVTTLYPNAEAPSHGVFVENRLLQLVQSGRLGGNCRGACPLVSFRFENIRRLWAVGKSSEPRDQAWRASNPSKVFGYTEGGNEPRTIFPVLSAQTPCSSCPRGCKAIRSN